MPDPIPTAQRPPANDAIGTIHHLELWVPDFKRVTASWGWLLGALGYERFQTFRNGVSWRHEETGAYIVIEQSPDMLAIPHDRHRPGMNHLAFRSGSREHVEHVTQRAQEHGWRLRERIAPSAGEGGYYATYLTDRDGFEVELVASSGVSQ